MKTPPFWQKINLWIQEAKEMSVRINPHTPQFKPGHSIMKLPKSEDKGKSLESSQREPQNCR